MDRFSFAASEGVKSIMHPELDSREVLVRASDYDSLAKEAVRQLEETEPLRTRVRDLEADLKAEWGNLNATTEALRNLVFALDHSGLEWDCTGNAPLGRLDDAMVAARAVLNPTLGVERGS